MRFQKKQTAQFIVVLSAIWWWGIFLAQTEQQENITHQ